MQWVVSKVMKNNLDCKERGRIEAALAESVYKENIFGDADENSILTSLKDLKKIIHGQEATNKYESTQITKPNCFSDTVLRKCETNWVNMREE